LTPRRIVWIVIVFLTMLLVSAGIVATLVGTDSGTRWLLARAKPYLPAQLDTGAVSGSLLGGIETRNLRWSDDSIIVSVGELRFSIALRPLFSRRIEIDALDANRIDVTLIESEEPPARDQPIEIDLPLTIVSKAASIRAITVTRADFNRNIDEIDLVGQLEGSALTLSRFVLRSDWLNVDIAGSAGLEAPYPAELRTQWSWTANAERAFAGTLEVSGSSERYEVAHALEIPVELDTEGTVVISSGDIRGDLTNRWQDLRVTAGDNVVTSPRGILHIEGTPDDYRVSADTLVQFADWPDGDIELEGEGNLDGLRVDNVIIETEVGRLRANGDVLWTPEPAWDLVFDASGLDPSFATEVMTGSLDAAGRTAGSIRADGPEFEIDVERVVGTLNDHPVDGELAVSLAGSTVMLNNAAVSVGGNHIIAAGRVREDIDLNVRLHVPSIENIVSDASGALEGDVRIRGTIGDLSVSGGVTAASLTWRDFAAGALRASGELAQTGIVDATFETSELRYRDNVAESVSARIAGRSDSHTIRASIKAPGNDLSFAAQGGLDEQSWNGQIDSLSLQSEVLGDWSLEQPTDLQLSPTTAALAEACLAAAAFDGKACAALAYADAAPLDFDVVLEGLPLTALPLSVPAGVNITGAVFGHARGQLDKQRLNSTASLEIRNASFATEYEGEIISATLEQAVANATVTDNRLDAELRIHLSDDYGDMEGQVNVADIFDTNSALAGNVEIDVEDLSIFPILLPSITDTMGRIEGSIAINGAPANPQFLGVVALRDGAFAVRRAGISVTDVDLELRQLESGRLGLAGRAKSGDGEIAISGSSEIVAGSELRAQLDLAGENFELIRLPDWRVAASPKIRMTMNNQNTVVSGDILIPTADITVRSVPETATQTSPDAIVHRADAAEEVARRRIDVDVRARLGNAVQVSAFGLTTGLEGDVRIKGGTHAPYVGAGRVQLREGRYKAYGQELTIERGELIFNGPLSNPNLDVRAVRQTKDVVAGVQLSGTPQQLSSTVFSEPPLSEAEALSYLLTGRPLAGASAGEGEMLNKAAFALGLSGAGKIASQIGNVVGLDTLSVEGGAEEGTIVAGKQVGERLFIEYGYGLVNSLGRILFRYQLNDRLVVETTSGVVNTVDLVYSRKKQ